MADFEPQNPSTPEVTYAQIVEDPATSTRLAVFMLFTEYMEDPPTHDHYVQMREMSRAALTSRSLEPYVEGAKDFFDLYVSALADDGMDTKALKLLKVRDPELYAGIITRLAAKTAFAQLAARVELKVVAEQTSEL